MKRLITGMIAALVLSGCAQDYSDFDDSVLATFRSGQATKKEIIRHLGDPLMVTHDQQGNELMKWIFVTGGVFQAKTKVLTVTAQDGIVKSFAVNDYDNYSQADLAVSKMN